MTKKFFKALVTAQLIALVSVAPTVHASCMVSKHNIAKAMLIPFLHMIYSPRKFEFI